MGIDSIIDMDFEYMTKKELSERLYDEVYSYNENLFQLCKIIVGQLPRRYVYRIISKLYRLRKQ